MGGLYVKVFSDRLGVPRDTGLNPGQTCRSLKEKATTMDPLPPARHHEPLKIAEDTYLIRQLHGEGRAPVSVYLNSLVIGGKEPIIVDTGTVANREMWINDVFSLVDPSKVRWIFISHDDHDHTGNLRQAMEMCPNATLVTNWFMVERLVGDFTLPLDRMRWVDDGDSFEANGRTYYAIRPPVFDSPTTRGLYDSKTGVYWGSDAFGSPVLHATDNAADLDPEFFRDGVGQFARLVAAWFDLVDPAKFNRTIDRVANLDLKVIASGHGPIVTGDTISKVIDFHRGLPGMEQPTVPGQAELEAIVAAMMSEEAAA